MRASHAPSRQQQGVVPLPRYPSVSAAAHPPAFKSFDEDFGDGSDLADMDTAIVQSQMMHVQPPPQQQQPPPPPPPQWQPQTHVQQQPYQPQPAQPQMPMAPQQQAAFASPMHPPPAPHTQIWPPHTASSYTLPPPAQPAAVSTFAQQQHGVAPTPRAMPPAAAAGSYAQPAAAQHSLPPQAMRSPQMPVMPRPAVHSPYPTAAMSSPVASSSMHSPSVPVASGASPGAPLGSPVPAASAPSDAQLRAEIATLRGEVALLRQREEASRRSKVNEAFKLSQASTFAKGATASSSGWPSSQSTSFPSSSQRAGHSSEQQQVQRLQAQLAAANAAKESLEHEMSAATERTLAEKRRAAELQQKLLQVEQQARQQQRAPGHTQVQANGQQPQQGRAPAQRPPASPMAPSTRIAPPPPATTTRVPSTATPTPVPAQAASTAALSSSVAPSPPHVPSNPSPAPSSSHALSSSWILSRRGVGGDEEARVAQPSFLQPGFVCRAEREVAPLELIMAELDKLKPAVPVIHNRSSSSRGGHASIVKLEKQPSLSASSVRMDLARACEPGVILWQQLRDCIYHAIHSHTTPLSTLLKPLRNLMLFCCTPVSIPLSSAAPQPLVKLEPQTSSASVHEKQRSSSDGSLMDELTNVRRQLQRLLLQLLLFCTTKDSSASSASMVYEELAAPSAALAAAADASMDEPMQPAVPAELESRLWEWAPIPSPSPPPRSPSSVQAPTPPSPARRLQDAKSFATLLRVIFDDALAALTSGRVNSHQTGGVHPLSLLELVVACIDAASHVGAMELTAVPTHAQVVAKRAGEDRMVEDWLPRVAHVLLATNAAAVAPPSGTFATPAVATCVLYSCASSILTRWCRAWPHRLTHVLQAATAVVHPSALQGSQAYSTCSCSVLELLLLWSSRLGDASTAALPTNQQVLSSIPAFAARDGPPSQLHRNEWVLRAMHLIGANASCWSEQLQRAQPPASLPVCSVHGREWGDREDDAHVLAGFISLLSLPLAQVRMVCQVFVGAVQQLHASGQRLSLHPPPDDPRSCESSHLTCMLLLHSTLCTLHAVLRPKHRRFRDVQPHLALLDSSWYQSTSLQQGRTEREQGQMEANHSACMMMQRVQEACTLIIQGAHTDKGDSPQQVQYRWRATVRMAQELADWLVA